MSLYFVNGQEHHANVTAVKTSDGANDPVSRHTNTKTHYMSQGISTTGGKTMIKFKWAKN
jgi:hypothetical protein